MRASALQSPGVVIACGGLVIALSMGVRHGFGLFLPPMTAAHGWGRGTFSFALAIQNLVWGFSQPLFGMLADRFGFGRVVTLGAACWVGGLLLMPSATTGGQLTLSAGVLIGLGLGATGWVVLGAISRRVPVAQQSNALGIASALGSLGQFVMMPYTQVLISTLGWAPALMALAATSAMIAPLALGLVVKTDLPAQAAQAPTGLRSAVGEALAHPGFWLLNLGFVVCGFQLAFLTNHLPAFLADQGLSPRVGMAALAIIGAANILGSYTCGYLGGRLRRKYLLSGLYLIRTSATVIYIGLPVTAASTLAYAVVMGLTWLGTVPLTSGVVSQIFGVLYLATLFGFVFLGHQLGGFAGVWLAGYVFDVTHSYYLVWAMGIALGVLSIVVHLPIDDRAVEVRAAARQRATA